MNKIVFQSGQTVSIVGIQKDCDCFHCGRPLKVGIVLNGFGGGFGSDCLSRAAAKQTINIGGRTVTTKLTGDAIRTRAIVAHKGADYANDTYGWSLPGPNFDFVLKSDLVWKD